MESAKPWRAHAARVVPVGIHGHEGTNARRVLAYSARVGSGPMRHWGQCGRRNPSFTSRLVDEAEDIGTTEKNMMDSSQILASPSVVVVGDVGERAIEELERSGLSVRVADGSAALGALGPEPRPGMILLD